MIPVKILKKPLKSDYNVTQLSRKLKIKKNYNLGIQWCPITSIFMLKNTHNARIWLYKPRLKTKNAENVSGTSNS